MRELALARMGDLGLRCRDVRTREVGIQDIHSKVKPQEVELVRRDYSANGGWETFLSYEVSLFVFSYGQLNQRRVLFTGSPTGYTGRVASFATVRANRGDDVADAEGRAVFHGA